VGARDHLDVRSYPRELRASVKARLAPTSTCSSTKKARWPSTSSMSEIDHSGAVILEAVTAVLANFPPK
jgi:hypothetical protein